MTLTRTTASRGTGTGLSDWGTVAYDAATGEQLWTARHNGPANGIDVPGGMAVAADGASFFVIGSSAGETKTDMTTIAYDTATGKELWADRHDGPAHGSDTPHDIATGPDGTVYVTGNTEGEGTRGDFTTIAYDPATGERTWVRRHNGKANHQDFAWDVAVTPDGGKVVVTGQGMNDPSGADEYLMKVDYVTIAYDAATGQPVWTGEYDGPAGASDIAHALAVDATGDKGVRIFVTGSSTTSGDLLSGTEVDFTTVAYFEPWKKP